MRRKTSGFANFVSKVKTAFSSTQPIVPIEANKVLVSGQEDQRLVLTPSHFKLAKNQSLRITSLETQGKLLYLDKKGMLQDVTLKNNVFSFNDLQAGKLIFVADANQFGKNYSQFNVEVIAGKSVTKMQAVVNIDGVNDAPQLVSHLNEIQFQKNNGDSVATFKVSEMFTATDADPNAKSGIAISKLGSGTWQYSTDGSNWTSIDLSKGTLLLESNATLRCTQSASSSDQSSIDYRAWDQTSGKSGDYVNISQTGGSTAFSDTAANTKIAFADYLIIDLPTFLNSTNDLNLLGHFDTALFVNGSSLKDVTLDQSQLNRLKFIKTVMFDDDTNYKISLGTGSSIEKFDFSRLSSDHSATVDASASDKAITVIGGKGDDTVMLSDGSIKSTLELGEGHDTLAWSGSSAFDDSNLGEVKNIDCLDITNQSTYLILDIIGQPTSSTSPAVSVALSDKLASSSDNQQLEVKHQPNGDPNKAFLVYLDVSGVSNTNTISLSGTHAADNPNKNSTYITGASGKNINFKDGFDMFIILSVGEDDITFRLGDGSQFITTGNPVEAITYIGTVDDLNQYDEFLCYAGPNSKLIIESSGVSSLQSYVPVGHYFLGVNKLAGYSGPVAYSKFNVGYNQLIFAASDSPAHYSITLGAYYEGHSFRSGGEGEFLYKQISPVFINYDATQLKATDSLIIDASQLADSVPLNIPVSQSYYNIKIIAGAEVDKVLLPSFDNLMSFTQRSLNIAKTVAANIQLGGGDDTFVLAKDWLLKTPSPILGGFNKQIVFDGGSDDSTTLGLGHGDTLQITGESRAVDLDIIGKFFKNMEMIELGETSTTSSPSSGHYSLSLSLDSMLKFTNNQDNLIIKGSSEDEVILKNSANQWTDAHSTQQIDGKNYQVYHDATNEHTLYIQEEIKVTLS